MNNPLNIIIPMAGRGSRFREKGFELPKPLVEIDGHPMIEWVIRNLTPDRPCRFVFLCLAEHLESYPRLRDVLNASAPGCSIIPVTEVTAGAACTVMLARSEMDMDAPMMIANTDQFVDIDISDYLRAWDACGDDGYIMTFKSSNPKWSYCRMKNSAVTEVIEKTVVSEQATVGIYNYRKCSDFIRAAEAMMRVNFRVNNEFYVAPTYNYLIEEGYRVGVYDIGGEDTRMHGLGTPEDYWKFLETECRRTHASAPWTTLAHRS